MRLLKKQLLEKIREQELLAEKRIAADLKKRKNDLISYAKQDVIDKEAAIKQGQAAIRKNKKLLLQLKKALASKEPVEELVKLRRYHRDCTQTNVWSRVAAAIKLLPEASNGSCEVPKALLTFGYGGRSLNLLDIL